MSGQMPRRRSISCTTQPFNDTQHPARFWSVRKAGYDGCLDKTTKLDCAGMGSMGHEATIAAPWSHAQGNPQIFPRPSECQVAPPGFQSARTRQVGDRASLAGNCRSSGRLRAAVPIERIASSRRCAFNRLFGVKAQLALCFQCPICLPLLHLISWVRSNITRISIGRMRFENVVVNCRQ